jgi:Lon protease-like protein
MGPSQTHNLDISQIPKEIPLFPLPNHVLMPGIPMPYRVFEDRYRTLIEDLLLQSFSHHWLAFPRLSEGFNAETGKPEIYQVASLAKMVRCVKLPDSEFQIVVEGAHRCRLFETNSSFPYRMARPELIPDRPIHPETDISSKLSCLQQGLLELAKRVGKDGESLLSLASDPRDSRRMVYRLGSVLLNHPDRRQFFLEERRLSNRINILIDTIAGILLLAEKKSGSIVELTS